MELKQRSCILTKRLFRVLIVPFMELKLDKEGSANIAANKS